MPACICCCFHKVAVALPYYCNSVWSVTPAARWSNSVLSTILSPTRLAQQSTTALFWEVSLSLHLHSQTLCLSLPLLSDSPVLREVGLSHHLILSPCSLSYLSSLRAHLLVPPAFSEAGSVFHSTPMVNVWLQFPFYDFQFCLGGFNMPRSCSVLCLQGEVRRVMCSACWSPVGSAGYARSFESRWWRELAWFFSQGRHLLGLCSIQQV
jgi:hypothetical protein